MLYFWQYYYTPPGKFLLTKKLGTTRQRTPAPLLIQWYFWVQSMVLHIQRIHRLTPAKLLLHHNLTYLHLSYYRSLIKGSMCLWELIFCDVPSKNLKKSNIRILNMLKVNVIVTTHLMKFQFLRYFSNIH